MVLKVCPMIQLVNIIDITLESHLAIFIIVKIV